MERKCPNKLQPNKKQQGRVDIFDLTHEKYNRVGPYMRQQAKAVENLKLDIVRLIIKYESIRVWFKGRNYKWQALIDR